MLPSSLIVDAKVSHHKVFLNHPVCDQYGNKAQKLLKCLYCNNCCCL